MIHGLDHIVLATRDLDATVAIYETLLGRPYDWSGTADGARHAWFQLANMSLAVVARHGSGPMGDWIDARLNVVGEGIAGIAFAVADLDEARRMAGRRGLPSADLAPLALHHRTTSETSVAPMAALAREATHGVHLSLVQRPPAPARAVESAGATITRLDHVVIHTQNPDRAVALYGGRLALDLRLDRANPDWGLRLLFFRCGDLVVEISHLLKGGVTDAPDELWGLSWRTPDLAATHARLTAAGIAVAEMRRGRRPGTRVFTLRDQRARVPTLILSRVEETE